MRSDDASGPHQVAVAAVLSIRPRGQLPANEMGRVPTAEAARELQSIVADYEPAYPSAMVVTERDLDALIVRLRFPSEHRKRIMTTNLLERTFGRYAGARR